MTSLQIWTIIVSLLWLFVAGRAIVERDEWSMTCFGLVAVVTINWSVWL